MQNLNQIIDYVKKEVDNGNHPSYKDLENKFKIGYRKITLNDIYPKVGVKVLDLKCKRPQSSLPIVKQELINYIKEESKLGRFPSRREIENKLRVRLKGLFDGGIKELYQKSGVKYVQKINQELKYKKAELFTKVIISILPKLELKLIESKDIHCRGIDILTQDKHNNKIGIELKAYNKYEGIKFRHIKQCLKFIKEERLKKAFLITSTSKIEGNVLIPKQIELISYDKLKSLCDKKSFKTLKYIRETSVNVEPTYKIERRKKIIEYVKNKVRSNERVSCYDISKDLHRDVRTYFNSIAEVYKEAGLIMPSDKFKGIRCKELFEEEKNRKLKLILDYVKKEVKKGYYPSEFDIKDDLGISNIRRIIHMNEIYKRIGKKPYLERLERKFKK